MPCLVGQFNPRIGPITNVGIVPAGTIPLPAASGQAVQPQPPRQVQIIAFPALIDTGAAATCIGPQVVKTLGLRPIGKRPMISATHAVPVNVYLVDLILAFGQAALHLSAMQVYEFAQATGTPFQVLLGRDVICRGILHLSFDGHFTFSI